MLAAKPLHFLGIVFLFLLFSRISNAEGPVAPDTALKTFKVSNPALQVELVVAEPLVQSPVAIDWDARGRMWVCEMFDYPTGVDERWKPGGRIKILSDSDGDGRPDRAALFLDGLPFPTGVTCWRGGALICAAPDILYAEDTDGDGRADVLKKLFSGFATDNYQARVNGLSLGLDNWIYGANGLLGGKIKGGAIKGDLDIRGHDFRFRPDTGAFEPVAGLTQHGRVRDDWEHWFGCENSRPLFHFPLEDRYLARNPKVAAPPPSVNVPAYPEANRVFPISAPVERYNDPGAAGHVTSGCGLGIYRDTLLGGLKDNAFVCEPVHNLVHREVLATDGVTFTSTRAEDEKLSEFLASSDHWFRPVQVRTGPDGALYVVDMYRFLIEHPRWIAADRLAKIDVRAGAEMGRIYRVGPKLGSVDGVKIEHPTSNIQHPTVRAIRDLTKLSVAELAAAIDTPNGTERDRVHLELLARADKGAGDTLAKLAQASRLPEVRVQALCALDGLHVLTPALVTEALADRHPRVREQAVRLCEQFTAEDSLRSALVALVNDTDRGVRLHLVLTLGELDDPRAGDALAKLAASDDTKLPYFRAALLSSALRYPQLATILGGEASPPQFALLSDAERERLKALPATTAGARAEVLRRYEPAISQPGNEHRGAEVFARACALCHVLGGVGFDLGPDLAPLRDKPADYLLKNILDPNAAIEPRFIAQIVELKDDRTVAAIIASESATSLTLKQPGGAGGTMLRSGVRTVHASKVSLMPEDFEQSITPQEMADLIAFLRAPSSSATKR